MSNKISLRSLNSNRAENITEKNMNKIEGFQSDPFMTSCLG